MTMKPFLILQLRPIDKAADGEFEAFLKYGGLTKKDVHRVRMETTDIPTVPLDAYSGVILGGGPSNVSDPLEKQNDAQKRFEAQLKPLVQNIIDQDFPFLGACYGFGYVAQHLPGGRVSKEQYAENVNAVEISLTPQAKKDPLLAGLPETFFGIVGHKESCQQLPNGAAWLASSPTCPYQMFRLKRNIYGTQFHPELDAKGAAVRIDVYKNLGYFPPEEAEPLKKKLAEQHIHVPQQILRRFVETYSREN